MLENLGQSGGEWYSGCGRHWHTPRRDTEVYRTLCQRGYVEEREIILHSNPAILFRMTRAGREWYFARTGKRVQRHPFAKVTEPYEEGEFQDQVSPGSSTQNAAPDTGEFDDYAVRDDGIQGWTVSSDIDNKDRRIIGNRKVWWVSQWGFDEAKRLAEEHAGWLNDEGSATKSNTGPAIAVPIMIAPFEV
jgi:hypothetical protein